MGVFEGDFGAMVEFLVVCEHYYEGDVEDVLEVSGKRDLVEAIRDGN